MIQILNQYSAVLIAAALFLVAAVALLRRQARWQEILALGVLAAGLVTAWLLLHPVQTPLMDDAKMVQSMIGQGKPVLLDFQSPY